MSLIGTPLGYIMYGCYMVAKNYGIALILFTLLTKLLLFPLSIKQQKNTARMAKFNPKMEQLRKKYGNNKEKLNEEMMKLYSEENYNPMGSCLPLVVTMIVLFGLIDVVYKPITHIVRVDKTALVTVEEFIEMPENAEFFGEYTTSKAYTSRKELILLQAIKSNEELFADESVPLYLENYFASGDEAYTNALMSFFTAEENADRFESYTQSEDFAEKPYAVIAAALSESSTAFMEGLEDYLIAYYPTDDAAIAKAGDAELYAVEVVKYCNDFASYRVAVKTFFENDYEDLIKKIVDFDNTFIGFDMGITPSWSSIYVLIPILSLLANFAVTIYSQRMQRKTNPSMQQMGMGMNMMLYLTPFMSFFIAFSVPAGVGFYWILSSLFSLLQSVILYKIYTPEYVEKLVVRDAAKKKAQGKKSMYEKALEAQQMSVTGTKPTARPSSGDDGDTKKSKSEMKEEERRKLNEARKRMAEKYGDDYNEE